MRLELHWSQVETLTAGTTTSLVEKALTVDLDELRTMLEADARLQRTRLDLTAPGDSCRIGRVVDVMAPQAKADGGENFPGYLASWCAPAAVRPVPWPESRWW
jgi:Glycine/sarcosine/betaine reductase component B subunits